MSKFVALLNHSLLENQKRGPVSDSDGATGAHRLVGARPVEHGCEPYFGSVKEKSNSLMGVKGACPLGCLPHWGREGVTLAISTQSRKLEGISPEPNFFSFLKKVPTGGSFHELHSSDLPDTKDGFVSSFNSNSPDEKNSSERTNYENRSGKEKGQ